MVDDVAGKSPPKNKVIWLASFPKSGNTWVRLFLASFLAQSDQFDPNAALKGSFHDASREIFDHLVNVQSAELSNKVIAALRLPFLDKLTTKGQHDIIVKTHVVHATWNDSALIPPPVSRKAIYVVRHPFDVACSMSRHMGISLDDAVANMNNPQFCIGSGNQLLQPVHTWSRHVDSWMNNTAMDRLVIRYEDMLARPHLTFASLLGFLALPTTGDKIDHAVAQTQFGNLQTFERQSGFVETSPHNSDGFFANGTAGGYRKLLSQAQQDQLWQDHHDVMQRLGYGSNGEY